MDTAVELLGGVLGVAAFGGLLYAGFAGDQDAQTNILPTVVFVLFWVGTPFVSLLLGDVFSLFSPWRAVGRATGWLASRLGGGGIEPLTYPTRLGRWPAAFGLLAFAWIQLVYPNKDDPSKLALLALGYAGVQWVGMTLYGERQWSRNADAFGVWFSFLGRLSPLEWHDRRLRLRPVLSGVVDIDMRPGTVAVVVVAIGTTSFDGFSQGTIWNSLAGAVLPRLEDGISLTASGEILFTAGLLAGVAVIAALYRLGIHGVHGIHRDHDWRSLSRLFGHTLIPIAMAYLVAHYFSLLAFQGQAIVSLASNPLGHGSKLLGSANVAINYTWLSSTAVWYVQVAALVAGHVAGLSLAHDRALTTYSDTRIATQSQYWMLGVMVCFTCLALYLLSAAAQ